MESVSGESTSSAAPTTGGSRVVFFDGVCALCDGTVRFLIRRDRNRILRFAPLQGATAASEKEVAELLKQSPGKLESLIYLRTGNDPAGREVLARSDAVLGILTDLGGFWRVVSWLRVVPRWVRDPIYDFVARNRYRWFGRFETCRRPAAGEQDLFLD